MLNSHKVYFTHLPVPRKEGLTGGNNALQHLGSSGKMEPGRQIRRLDCGR